MITEDMTMHHLTRSRSLIWLTALLAALAIACTGATPPAEAQAASYRIVSTSGIPHGDVADYRQSPEWQTGYPKGANVAWDTYMTEAIRQVTSASPDVVLHTGDMVEGRWYKKGSPAVYGPRGTWTEQKQVVHNAADTIYPWIKGYWSRAGYGGSKVLWGMGDHEIGDLGSDGVNEPSMFRYKAFEVWRTAWKRHFGNIKHNNLRGNVGIVTLDPFVKWDTGIRTRIRSSDFDYLADKVAALRSRGADWIIVQSEIPARGPNRERGTSGLILENGSKLWDELDDLGVDLLLSAEFHDDTTYTTGGATPMQVVHGGRHQRLSWLQIDVHGDDRLELTLRESQGAATGSGTIWAPTSHRLNNKPVAGSPSVTGRATINANGSVTGRSGRLTEGL